VVIFKVNLSKTCEIRVSENASSLHSRLNCVNLLKSSSRSANDKGKDEITGTVKPPYVRKGRNNRYG